MSNKLYQAVMYRENPINGQRTQDGRGVPKSMAEASKEVNALNEKHKGTVLAFVVEPWGGE